MLRRPQSLFVEQSVHDGGESFCVTAVRMTDRLVKRTANHQAGNLNLRPEPNRDVTKRPSESVRKDIESSEAPPPLQDCSDAHCPQASSDAHCPLAIMTSNQASKQQDESSTDYFLSLSPRPQHVFQDSKSRSKPRLTLSAFRRPEESVRVADPDRTRKLSDSYKLSGGIGHGAMSTVRLAERRSDGTKFAIKTVSKHDVLRTRRFGRRPRHMDEWEALRMLKDNPNVIDLIDVYETDDEVQMVLEYCGGGELFDYIQRKRTKSAPYAQSEVQAAKITEQMLSVLNDLHGRGIVHRDVKPENLLLTTSGGNEVKICDFGIARLLQDDCDSPDTCSSDDEGSSPGRNRAYSKVGSDLYAAPEVCMGDGYGTAVDMYSLGVTIYVFLYGFPPIFDLQDDGEAGVSFPDTNWSRISEDAKDLIRCMLEVDPEQRITAEKALNSAWIKRIAGCTHFSGVNGRIAAQRRSSHLFSLSPAKPRPTVDLELVKARLYKNLAGDRKRIKSGISGAARKRRRMSPRVEHAAERRTMPPRADGAHVSMADLYRGVASAAVSATNAAKGVVYDDRKNEIKVLVDDSINEASDDDVDSIFALSV